MTPAQDMHVPWAPPCVVWKLVEVVGERLHAELFMRYKHRCTDEYHAPGSARRPGGRLAPSAAVWGNNKLGNATATLVAPTAVAGNGARGSEGGRLSRAAEGHTPVIFLPHRAPILLMRAASGAFYSQPC